MTSTATGSRGEPGDAPLDLVRHIRLLGTPTIVGDHGHSVTVTRPQAQLVLAFLVIERRTVDRGELAELLWGQGPLADHWQGALRGVLSKVRELFSDAGIDDVVHTRRDGTIRIQLPDDVAVDLDLARNAVDRAGDALDGGDPDTAIALTAPWLTVLQQPFLTAGDGDWVRTTQDQVTALARRATVVDTSALLTTGLPAPAAEAARAWIHRHPLDEFVHQLLIEALLAQGDRVGALEAFHTLETILDLELGIRPSPEVAALVRLPGSRDDAPPEPRKRHRRHGTASDSTATTRPEIFLGRIDELAIAVDVWNTTRADNHPRLLEIEGRSGVGKTRLAGELAVIARAEGADVRIARCSPGVMPPFEPLQSAVGIDETTTDVGPTNSSTARGKALRQIRAGITALVTRPALLVVDDIQWASSEVLAALDQALTDLTGPLLVVTTGRQLPAEAHDTLAHIARALPTTTLALGDLTRDDLLPLFADDDAPDARAEELHRRTGGHPLFVSEVAISPWRAGEAIHPEVVPGGLRSWIGHRADALDELPRAVLDTLSVFTAAVDVEDIARCAGFDPREVAATLDDLVEEGLVVEGTNTGTFEFAHVITRDAVYERLRPSHRTRLHAQVADLLAAGPTHPGRSATIAHHLQAAGHRRKTDAAGHLLRAGREAIDAGAWADAEKHFGQARSLVPERPDLLAGALTGLAWSLHLQRRRDEAEALIDQVIALTRVHRLPVEFAEAVLVLVGRAGRGATQHLDDLEQAELLREARDWLDATASELDASDTTPAERVRRAALACRVEGELAMAIYLTAPPATRRKLIERVVARAAALDPPDTRVTAHALLVERSAFTEPEQVTERVIRCDQVLAISPSGRTVDATLTALVYRHEDHLLAGDRDAARATLTEAAELTTRADHPYWSWAVATWQALSALMDGDPDRAEALATAAAALQDAESGAHACLGVNLVNIRLYQGRPAEVLDLLDSAAIAQPHIPCYRAVHALCAIEAGDDRAGRASYEVFRSTDFAAIPHDSNRLLTLVVLADVAVQLDDEPSLATLRTLLLPAAPYQSLLNCYGGGGATWGPVAHQLGRISACLGDHEEAARWFTEAERSATAMGTELALARILTDPLRITSELA